MRRSFIAGFLLTAVLLAMPDTTHAQQGKKRGDRFRITPDELAEAAATSTTAADLIRTMRPQWLSPPMGRNTSASMGGSNDNTMGGGAKEVQIYVDDVRQPNLDVLNTIKATELVELRYLDQNRAVQMKGPGHEMGVIDITTVNKKK